VTGLSLLLDGLSFPEAPRWHQGRLWFSDFHAHQVVAVDLEGHREAVVEVPGQPSGLGWLPDGRLLVVSMLDRRLLRLDAGGLVEVADLTPYTAYHCNDMVVDDGGRAYIGNFGFNSEAGQPPAPATLCRVDPDGTVTVVDEDLLFPNGSVITADGSTLIVAESWSHRLTAWDHGPDGSLTGRRLWADLDPDVPDGICGDGEGAVWFADPIRKQVVRVHEGGRVSERISTHPRRSVACMLGGDDRRTLFVCTSERVEGGDHVGRIEYTEVAVGGAGLP
jgi:sugar lactone lactonase YvrE